MVVKFSTLAGGVWIEVNALSERTGSERCFRFDNYGNAEYAFLSDLSENGDRARWYGHAYKQKDFLFA